MFKPWAITSITIAVVLAFVLWARMIRFEYALIVSTATAAATLAYAPAEPYAAVITVLLPPVFVLAWSGLRGGTRAGGWAAVVGVGALPRRRRAVLHAAARVRRVHAGDHGACALALARRSVEPLLRLVVIGVIAGAIALIGWVPYLLAAVGGTPADTGHGAALPSARRRPAVLPDAGVHPARRAVHGRHASGWWYGRAARPARRRWRSAWLAVYAWSLLSMLTTLVGTTLLSFRLQPTLTVLLTAAGAFGFIEATLADRAPVQPADAAAASSSPRAQSARSAR